MPGGNDDVRRAITRRVGGRLVHRTLRDEIVAEPPIDIGLLLLDPFPVTALRTADLLLVRFSFENLRFVDVGVASALQRRVANRPAFLSADFPPQHLVEQAFAEQGNPGTVPKLFELPGGVVVKPDAKEEPNVDPPAPPVQAGLSAHSRLVFKVMSETIVWSLEGLLAAMSTLPLNIAPHATNPSRFFTPFDVTLVDRLTTTRVQRRLLAREAVAVPATVRSMFRASAATKVLEYRVGRGASGAVGAASNLAADLGINAKVSAAALRTLPLPPRSPTDTQTAIELPWRMQLSPHADGAFAHAVEPVDPDGRVERSASPAARHRAPGPLPRSTSTPQAVTRTTRQAAAHSPKLTQ
jgi:hypothetical protein